MIRFSLRHYLADGDIEAALKAQIAVGENAHQLPILGDRNAGNFVLAHNVESVGNLVVGRHGDGIDDHAALGALYFVDFIGLLLDGQIAMDQSRAALLRHGNGHVRFGNRVHGGADDGDIQADIAGELSLRIGLRGYHIATSRQQQHVIEGKRFWNGKMNHSFLKSVVWQMSG